MVGESRLAGLAEDVADGPGGPGMAGEAGNVPVSRDPPHRDAFDDPEDTASEARVSGQC